MEVGGQGCQVQCRGVDCFIHKNQHKCIRIITKSSEISLILPSEVSLCRNPHSHRKRQQSCSTFILVPPVRCWSELTGESTVAHGEPSSLLSHVF